MGAVLHSVANPADLALAYIDTISPTEELETSSFEKGILRELDHLVDDFDMNGAYFTKAGLALEIPKTFEAGQDIEYYAYNGIYFEGKLATFSVVQIGRRRLGALSVRALCLSFNDVTVLTGLNTLSSGRLLHVPALAIDAISRA